MNDYQGIVNISDEELNKIAPNVKKRQAALKEKGIEYMIAIAPDKQTIYPEYLPNNIKKINDKTRLDEILNKLSSETSVKIVDLRSTMIKNKDKGTLYYKTDTHWNDLGAYYGYKEIMKNLKNYYPYMNSHNISEYSFEKSNFSGNISTNMLDLNKYINENVDVLDRDYKSIQFSEYNNNENINIVEARNKNMSLSKLIMFRDSFPTKLIKNLSSHFSKSTFVWSHNFDFELIEKERLDIVIHEIVERYAQPALTEEN